MRPTFYSDWMTCLHYDNLLSLLSSESFRYAEAANICAPPDTARLFALLKANRTLLEPRLNALAENFPYRLGKYAESLISFALQYQTEVTGTRFISGLQLHDEHGVTQGELDFLVSEKTQTHVEHWELAVKFYLEWQNTDGISYWLGPQLKDALHLKLRHIASHQIPLGQRHQAQIVARFQNARSVHSRLLVVGQRYRPATTLRDGCWLTWADLANDDADFCIIPRRCWIAPKNHVVLKVASGIELAEQHGNEQLMVGRVTKGRVMESSFIVPKDWSIRAEEYVSELLRKE